MELITRYGDVGTQARHKKFGGVVEDNIDGQMHARVKAEDCLDALLVAKVISQEQFNACYQLCRDYKIGCLYKYRIVKDYLRSTGLNAEEADEERERSKKAFYAAIKYNNEFIIISDLTHIILEQIGIRIPAPWKMQQLADRLIKYYKM